MAETTRRTSYFDSQNCEVEFLSHPFWGLRGNVDASCVRRWKKRGRLPIANNWTLYLALTTAELRSGVFEPPFGDLGER